MNSGKGKPTKKCAPVSQTRPVSPLTSRLYASLVTPPPKASNSQVRLRHRQPSPHHPAGILDSAASHNEKVRRGTAVERQRLRLIRVSDRSNVVSNDDSPAIRKLPPDTPGEIMTLSPRPSAPAGTAIPQNMIMANNMYGIFCFIV